MAHKVWSDRVLKHFDDFGYLHEAAEKIRAIRLDHPEDGIGHKAVTIRNQAARLRLRGPAYNQFVARAYWLGQDDPIVRAYWARAAIVRKQARKACCGDAPAGDKHPGSSLCRAIRPAEDAVAGQPISAEEAETWLRRAEAL